MQIIDSIRLWSSNKSTRAGVTPRIITPLKIYPGRFWDLPESTPGLNLGYTPGYIMAAPMIYPSIPGSTPFLWFGEVSSDPRIYPSLPEYTPPFQQMYMCDHPRIYSSLPEHTAPFQQLYAALQESTPPSQNNPPPLFNQYNIYVRPSQNPPIPSRINPPFQTICMSHTPPPPRIYPSFQQLYATLPESTPPLPFLISNYWQPCQK